MNGDLKVQLNCGACFLGDLVDLKIRDFISSPDKYIEALEKYFQIFPNDGFPAISLNLYTVEQEAMGADVEYYDDALPQMNHSLLKNLGDFEKLKIPCEDDFETSKQSRWIYNIVKKLIDRTEGIKPIWIYTQGPISLACGLRGYNNLIRDMRSCSSKTINGYLDFCVEVENSYSSWLKSIGVKKIRPRDYWASPLYFSRNDFNEYIYLHLAKFVKSHKTNYTPYFIEEMPEWEEQITRYINESGIKTIRVSKIERDVIRKMEMISKKLDLRGISILFNENVLVNNNMTEVVQNIHDIFSYPEDKKSIRAITVFVPRNTPHENISIFLETLEQYR